MPKAPGTDSEETDALAFSALLRAAQRGDRAAHERLYGRFGRYVLTTIRGQLLPPLRSRYDTMDLSQSVFAEVLRDLPGFEDRGEPAFVRWLAIKSKNKVRQKLRKTLGRNGERREADLDVVGDQAALGAAPDALVDARERAARVTDRLVGLDEVSREIIRLRWDEDLRFDEIAERLELTSPDAVRKRYARILVRLREGLDEE